MTETRQIYQLSHLLPGRLMIPERHAGSASDVDCPSSWLTVVQALDHAAALYDLLLLSWRLCALVKVLQGQVCCAVLCRQVEQAHPLHCLAAVGLQFLLQLKSAVLWLLLQHLELRGHARWQQPAWLAPAQLHLLQTETQLLPCQQQSTISRQQSSPALYTPFASKMWLAEAIKTVKILFEKHLLLNRAAGSMQPITWQLA